MALVSARIYAKWFSWPEARYLAPLWVLSGLVIVALWLVPARMPFVADRWSWGPFARATCLWATAFGGMTYSFYPTVVPDRLTIHAAASAPESLRIILFGTLYRAANDPAAYGAGLSHLSQQGDGATL